MPGLTRKCKPGGTIQIGEALVRVLKVGQKATLNVVAPKDVTIKFINDRSTSEEHSPSKVPGADGASESMGL